MNRCVWMLLVATSLSAQTIPNEEVKVRIRFRTLSFDAPIKDIGFLDNGEFRHLNIATDAFSAEQEYVGPRNLQFGIAEDAGKPLTRPPSPEMQAATQRLNRAKTASLKASEEYVEITKLLQKIGHQSSERTKPLTQADKEQIIALEAAHSLLTEQMMAASKEIEAAGWQILRLQSLSRPAGENPEGIVKKKEERVPAAKKSTVINPTAAVNFPHDGRYLLLFSHARKDQEVLALDDAEGIFPYGSQMLINLTGTEIEVRYPGQLIRIPANGHSVIKRAAPDYEYATGEIYTHGPAGPEIGCTLRSYQHPDIRTLYFLIPTEVGGTAVGLRGIQERKPKDTPAASVNPVKPAKSK